MVSQVAKTIIGSLVEVIAADFLNVFGLAIQKIAVMRIVETKRIERARLKEKARVNGQNCGLLNCFLEENNSLVDFGGVDISTVLSETCSEVMTVLDENLPLEIECNETQVPSVRDLITSRLWIFGLAIFIIGNLFEFSALALTTQTIVALLSNFTLIWNVFLSVRIFKEEFNFLPLYREWKLLVFYRWDASHCIILLCGSMMTVFSCPVVF